MPTGPYMFLVYQVDIDSCRRIPLPKRPKRRPCQNHLRSPPWDCPRSTYNTVSDRGHAHLTEAGAIVFFFSGEV